MNTLEEIAHGCNRHITSDKMPVLIIERKNEAVKQFLLCMKNLENCPPGDIIRACAVVWSEAE